MMTVFEGFDHLDVRVRSLGAVEEFYDRLMPELGLPTKRRAVVDEQGDWREPSPEHPYNVVEYYEAQVTGSTAHFIGFIEDTTMLPTQTRIAFRVASPAELEDWHQRVSEFGARNVERSASDDYPALFFEDPAGTKLELVAIRPMP
jgi:catechol 2,3-dioxygenase-like lactoylglutathione lyase family enzyme